jgi:4'-phosphopantetheinyl transferase
LRTIRATADGTVISAIACRQTQVAAARGRRENSIMGTCASVRECPTTGKSHDLPDSPLSRILRRIALPDAAVEVWLMPLDVTALQLHQCSLLLSHDEHARVARFQFEHDRRRYSVARGMLRMLLGNYLDMPAATIAFELERYGKPRVANPRFPVHFNLSHSADLAIYAISGACAPGVDIEWLDRDIDHDALARKFFSAREVAQLQRIPPAARKRAFLTAWTRKEAVVKATGDGLRVPLDRIEVTVDPDAQPQLLTIPAGKTADWTLYSANAGRAYAATVALHRAS